MKEVVQRKKQRNKMRGSLEIEIAKKKKNESQFRKKKQRQNRGKTEMNNKTNEVVQENVNRNREKRVK